MDLEEIQSQDLKAIVLTTKDGERMQLGWGTSEGNGARLQTGKYIDNNTFQKNYPGSRLSIETVAYYGQDEPG